MKQNDEAFRFLWRTPHRDTIAELELGGLLNLWRCCRRMPNSHVMKTAQPPHVAAATIATAMATCIDLKINTHRIGKMPVKINANRSGCFLTLVVA